MLVVTDVLIEIIISVPIKLGKGRHQVLYLLPVLYKVKGYVSGQLAMMQWHTARSIIDIEHYGKMQSFCK